MKIIITSLLLLSAPWLMAQQSQAVTDTRNTVQATYTRGVLAMNRGEVTEAEKAFRDVLQAQPQHPDARYQLSQLMMNREKLVALHRENVMKRTMLTEIDFSEAPLSECLESMTLLIKDVTKQKFLPNFIVKDPQGKLKDKTVTLKLSNIPASQALQYIAAATQCKVHYEEHAIIIEAN
jgi:hypothetical protein